MRFVAVIEIIPLFAVAVMLAFGKGLKSVGGGIVILSHLLAKIICYG